MASIEDLRLGEKLLSRGVIDETQLARCLRILHERQGSVLAEVLSEQGLVPRSECEETLLRTDSRVTLPAGGPEVPTAERRAFGRYVLLQELGHGGMGVVYRAFDPQLGREVALKRLRGLSEKKDLERFLHEARAAARLNHPGIVPVYDVGDVDGAPYYTMELVQGRTLSDLLQAGALSRREVVSIVRDVALAAHAAHEAGIVHRDLKPANVLVTLDETRPPGGPGRVTTARLADFGLAKDSSESDLTQTGQILGTPAYMSPEQALGLGRVADRRSDVFSLGAILYEALVGVPPFLADEAMKVLERIRNEDPVAPRRVRGDLPRDLETIVLRALEKIPSARYPTALALAEDLDRWLDDRPVLARPITPIGRALRWVRRNRLKSALIVAGLLAVLNPVVLAWHQKRVTRESAERLRIDGESQVEAARRALAAHVAKEGPAEDEIARRRGERALAELVRALRDGAGTLAQALALDPSNDATRDALAESYFALYEEAKRSGRSDEAAAYEKLVRTTASAAAFRERYEARFRREGRLSIETTPAGLEAFLYRYEEEDDTRLVATPWSPSAGRQRLAHRLGETPCGPFTLPEGSYLVVLRRRGVPPLRVPVVVAPFQERRLAIAAPKRVPRGFAWVPAGEYLYPHDKDAPAALTGPRRIVKAFFIAIHEATNVMWAEHAHAEWEIGRVAEPLLGPWPRPMSRERRSYENGLLPAGRLTWAEAQAYVAWRAKKDGAAYRLPTEEEWEVAARGADGRWFPWGNYFSPRFARTRLSAPDRSVWPLQVGTVPEDESPFGARDMAGNMAEWTSSVYSEKGKTRVVKGGSWGWDAMYARAAGRIDAGETLRDDHIGFRLALDAESGKSLSR